MPHNQSINAITATVKVNQSIHYTDVPLTRNDQSKE